MFAIDEDAKKEAAARRVEFALRVNGAAMEAVVVAEADVGAKNAVVSTMAAELAAGQETTERVVAAHEILSRTLEQTTAKLSGAKQSVVRSSFDGSRRGGACARRV